MTGFIRVGWKFKASILILPIPCQWCISWSVFLQKCEEQIVLKLQHENFQFPNICTVLGQDLNCTVYSWRVKIWMSWPHCALPRSSPDLPVSSGITPVLNCVETVICTDDYWNLAISILYFFLWINLLDFIQVVLNLHLNCNDITVPVNICSNFWGQCLYRIWILLYSWISLSIHKFNWSSSYQTKLYGGKQTPSIDSWPELGTAILNLWVSVKIRWQKPSLKDDESFSKVMIKP